jgi:hypothetical protein
MKRIRPLILSYPLFHHVVIGRQLLLQVCRLQLWSMIEQGDLVSVKQNAYAQVTWVS